MPRRSSLTVMCGIVSTSCRRKSICDPCIRPAIMMVKPTPMATPNMPTSVWRTRVLTWVHAMLSKRFVAIGLTVDWLTYLDRLSGRRVFPDVPSAIVHDGIDVSGDRSGYHGIVGVGGAHHDSGGFPSRSEGRGGSRARHWVRSWDPRDIGGRRPVRFCPLPPLPP